MLKEAIRKNWRNDITNYALKIDELFDVGYPAWTVRFQDGYGVAVPYSGGEEINENFANARIYSRVLNSGADQNLRALVLSTDLNNSDETFVSLCEALVDPGENGEQRAKITNSPVSWWREWKELLGNRNIDERIYDVLGELCVLKYALENGEDPEWNGPDGASYDIETEQRFLEVKSSTQRQRKEVTISSQFQLNPPGKPLYLVFCLFERSISTGISIDGIIREFEQVGYNTDLLNSKLEMMGLEQGMSARKKTFLLHEMLMYTVDETFPRITPEMFVNGVLPVGITKISYTVDLTGLTPISLIQGD